MKLPVIAQYKGRKIGIAAESLQNFKETAKQRFEIADNYDITVTDSLGAEIMDDDYFMLIEKNSILTIEEETKKVVSQQSTRQEKTLKTVFPNDQLENGDHVRMMGKVSSIDATDKTFILGHALEKNDSFVMVHHNTRSVISEKSIVIAYGYIIENKESNEIILKANKIEEVYSSLRKEVFFAEALLSKKSDINDNTM